MPAPLSVAGMPSRECVCRVLQIYYSEFVLTCLVLVARRIFSRIHAANEERTRNEKHQRKRHQKNY